RLVKVAADSFEAWFNFGLACQGATLSDEAAAAFSKAAQLRPGSVEALSGLGKALLEKGDFSGARAAYESAAKSAPENQAVLWNLVLVAERQGAAADAERFCAKLASKSPESDEVAFRLGSLRFSQSDWAGSAAAFRATLKIKPDSPAAQLNLGLALWKSGKPDEARKALEAVSTAPFCIDALHYLAV